MVCSRLGGKTRSGAGMRESATKDVAAPPAPLTDLDRSLAQGVAWTAGLRWAAQIVSWASTLIVARLLSPSDYGLVAMATVVLGFITLLNEFGLGSAVIKHRELTEHQVAQVHGLCIAVGFVGMAVGLASAYPLARFYERPELVAVVAVLSSNFVITAFRTIPLALLQRDLQFRTVAINDGVQTVVLSIAMVVFAALGFRYWTLVIGGILAGLISTGLAYYYRPQRPAWPRLSEIREPVRLGAHVVGARVGWYVYQNADFLIAGKVLGAAALGAYSIAWTIASIPVEKVSAMVGRVTPGFFSAVQDDLPTLRRYFLQLTAMLGLITIPAAVGMALVAPEFVELFLGEKWRNAVAPLQLLAIYASLRSIVTLFPSVAVITGLSGFGMRNALLGAVVMPAAFLVGSRWGATGIAAAWIVAYPLVVLPLWRVVLRRIELPAGAYLRAMWPAVSSAVLMALAVVAMRLALPPMWQLSVRLGAMVVLGLIVYCASLFILHAQLIREGRDLLKRLRSRA
jgi:PST family polysaccharide transporter